LNQSRIIQLPQELEEVPALAEDEIFELSKDAQQFLETLASRACVRRAHADARTPPAQSQIPGVLTVKDMREIFSVLSPVVADDDAVAAMMDRHPWESPPVFQVMNNLTSSLSIRRTHLHTDFMGDLHFTHQ
jgi:hypothetical protein